MKSTLKGASLRIIGLTSLLLCSCMAIAQDNPAPTGPAYVDLRIAVTEGPNEVYEPRTSIQVPEGHTIGDNLFPYEGIGWENELVGYRLYLDERAVTDIYGKQTPGVVLNTVDYRSKYHELAPWGMDVMHVGPSTGIGGLGLYRDDKLERFGNDGSLFAEVVNGEGEEVSFKIKHRDLPMADGKTGSVDATYTLRAGSPLTWVTFNSTYPRETLATGLVDLPGGKFIKHSNETAKGEWRYIAMWSDTGSETKDGLGTVLFFRAGEARIMPAENESRPIRFNAAKGTYAFAGIWSKGPMGITTREEFIQWCDEQQAGLPQ